MQMISEGFGVISVSMQISNVYLSNVAYYDKKLYVAEDR